MKCYRNTKHIYWAVIFAVLLCCTPITLAISETSSQSSDPATYIIILEDQPVASYRGGIPGFPATSPAVTGEKKINFKDPKTIAYRDYLTIKRLEILETMNVTLKRSIHVVHEYDIATNGMAVLISASEAEQIARLPGIKHIKQEEIYQLQSKALPVMTKTGQTKKGGIFFNSSISGISLLGAWCLFMVNILVVATGKKVNRKFLVFTLIILMVSMGAVYCSQSDDDDDDDNDDDSTDDTIPHSLSAGWIGAEGIWTGTTTGGLPGTMGEGIVIAILDTGITPEHPVFAEVGYNGYSHTNPHNQYHGVCNPNEENYDPNFPCNNKLIGAWGYVNDDDPRDHDGHGTCVASNAAGNIIEDVEFEYNNGQTVLYDFSGVAPHANIISYCVCTENGCLQAAILEALDQVVIDGADIINISIGGGKSNPWLDNEALTYLSIREAGIFVATSAGNSGPDPDTLTSPGLAPWLLTVAATTYDSAIMNSLTGMTGGNSSPADIHGKGNSVGYGPARIVYAGDYNDPHCRGNFNASFSGEIVVCDRGSGTIGNKLKSVIENGGGGMIVAEINEGDMSDVSETYFTSPALHIQYSDSVILKTWLSSGSNHSGSISGGYGGSDPTKADIMGDFSSRGPNSRAPSIIKPDITAPGVAVLGAWRGGDVKYYRFLDGTSFSSPHMAGAAALLKALHPDWNSAEIQSAMMSTSTLAGVYKYGKTPVDPFDVGSGRIDLGQAAQAGLILDITTAQFKAADPSFRHTRPPGEGGEPSELNLASVGYGYCAGSWSWTRTLKNVLGSATNWTVSVIPPEGVNLSVSPSSFTVGAAETQIITISASVTSLAQDTWAFGRISLTEDNNNASPVYLPVALFNSEEILLPGRILITTSSLTGSVERYRLQAPDVTDLTLTVNGLVKGEPTTEYLISDPTNDDPYDGFDPLLDGAFFITVEVPENSKRLIAETTYSESSDLDLFVGTGTTPSSETEIGSSASENEFEYVNVKNPAAGTYWILVHNWSPDYGSEPPGQLVTLLHAVVSDTDTGTMTVTPDTTTSNVFNITVSWDVPALSSGDRWWGVFDLATDSAAASDNIGSIAFNLEGE
ncbi:S8 family serine peptidase [candidate division CSSED10-310 bacterium]|uniref:S8 family serine peptidase n=1 Tax=candidate division CSSED10-310 bacterium TaxID=2855610 RepID=A0ABV6YTD7_UNCC1